METKKYIVLADTSYMENHLEITNIRYGFVSKNLGDTPTCNLNYAVDFTADFYWHIRFYEVFFNKKEKAECIIFSLQTISQHDLLIIIILHRQGENS